jgi:hypothetical protein
MSGDYKPLARYEGDCTGGPLDGSRLVTRQPAGFLLVNRPAGELVAYRAVGPRFVAAARGAYDRADLRAMIGEPDHRLRLDVLAYDPERMAPW